ncbi:hypothetical protein JCM19240_3718 [Vibrio maritimus]|uniref:Uncharacterized protein n=1 Tax=Vibrio maritimus TaxID=990268 RepID=A0A090T7Y0_9VIBR|nr:hypothetical protein JCM19240_3718 [Vibrio maritimus]
MYLCMARHRFFGALKLDCELAIQVVASLLKADAGNRGKR